ncbi:MAG: dockerin type I domain-containing protein [Candidatus Omnitrophica bacterium]|nr:dockerin type I domain-containing protein [Candidatus Omnitrophota bacterium]
MKTKILILTSFLMTAFLISITTFTAAQAATADKRILVESPMADAPYDEMGEISDFATTLKADPVDINKDGVIDARDMASAQIGYALAFKHANSLPAAVKRSLDRNRDGKVTKMDLLLVTSNIAKAEEVYERVKVPSFNFVNMPIFNYIFVGQGSLMIAKDTVQTFDEVTDNGVSQPTDVGESALAKLDINADGAVGEGDAIAFGDIYTAIERVNYHDFNFNGDGGRIADEKWLAVYNSNITPEARAKLDIEKAGVLDERDEQVFSNMIIKLATVIDYVKYATGSNSSTMTDWAKDQNGNLQCSFKAGKGHELKVVIRIDTGVILNSKETLLTYDNKSKLTVAESATRTYDVSGTLQKAEYSASTYDGSGKLVSHVAESVELSTASGEIINSTYTEATNIDAAGTIMVEVTESAVFGADGKVIGSSITESHYNASGVLIERVASVLIPDNAGRSGAGTKLSVKYSIDAAGAVVSTNVYNEQGGKVAALSGEGYKDPDSIIGSVQAAKDAELKAAQDAAALKAAQDVAALKAVHDAVALKAAQDAAALKAAKDAELKAAQDAAALKAAKDAELKATQEAEQKAAKEAELKAAKDAELKAAKEAELKAAQEAEIKAAKEAELKVAKEAELKAAQEAEQKAAKEAELKAAQEAEIKAAKDAELKAAKEAELKAAQEAEIKAAKEAELKAVKEAELKAAQEADLKAAELKAAKEAELKAAKEAELKAAQEAEIKAAKEAELKAAKEAELKAAKDAELKAAKEAELKAAQEAEIKAAKEAERKAAETEMAKRLQEEILLAQEKIKAAQEAELKVAQEAELKAAQEADLKAAELKAAKEAELKAAQEAEIKAAKDAELKAAADLKAAQDAADKAAKDAQLISAPFNAVSDMTKRLNDEVAATQAKLKAAADLKAAQDAEVARIAAEQKAAQDAADKAAKEAELKAAQDAEAAKDAKLKAAADLKAAQEADFKAAAKVAELKAADIKNSNTQNMGKANKEELGALEIIQPVLDAIQDKLVEALYDLKIDKKEISASQSIDMNSKATAFGVLLMAENKQDVGNKETETGESIQPVLGLASENAVAPRVDIKELLARKMMPDPLYVEVLPLHEPQKVDKKEVNIPEPALPDTELDQRKAVEGQVYTQATDKRFIGEMASLPDKEMLPLQKKINEKKLQ